MNVCVWCYRGRLVHDIGNLIAVHTQHIGSALVSPLAARRLLSPKPITHTDILHNLANRAVGCRTSEGSYTIVSAKAAYSVIHGAVQNFAPAHFGRP